MCQFMTVTEVAQHVSLDWKTVKNIDKMYLEAEYGQPDYEGLCILAVDEIAVRKGHNYLTVVLDYLSGRVLYVGKDRKSKTLKAFFNQLSQKQRDSIEAVVMDMWDPFIKAVKKNFRRLKSSLICSMWWPNLTVSSIRCETANIVRPLKKTRPSLKVSNTWLKNRKNIRLKTQREQLKQLLELNEVINTTMILKESSNTSDRTAQGSRPAKPSSTGVIWQTQ